MIAITAENTKNLPTTVTAKPQTWDKRSRAQAAAVKEIGPHAREGFEFETFKCDGRWGYRLTDGTRPENHAQLKANGGKRSLLAQAVAIEAKGGTAPKQMLEKAFDEVAGKNKLSNIQHVTVKDAVTTAIDAGLTPKQFRKVSENIADALAGEVVAKSAIEQAFPKGLLDHTLNKNGMPKFLERAPETVEAQKARIERHKKTTGAGRTLKNPPDAGKAKAKADKEKKTSMMFVGKSAILAGKTNDQALIEVKAAFPECIYKASDMQWIRRKLIREGMLSETPAPKKNKSKKGA